MKTGRASLASLLSLVVLLVGCSPARSPGPATETSPSPSNPWVERDGAIRPVRMTSGRALTYVQPETGSQILCQVLSKDRWERLLNGRVGRHPVRPSDSACMIAGASVGLSLSLHKAHEPFEAETTVAGIPAAPTRSSAGMVGFRVALSDDALHPREIGAARPLLELSVNYATDLATSAQHELAMRILNEVVPLLSTDGDPLPDIDDQGHFRYVSTPMITGGQIVDLPQPVQALQLCTVMLEAPAIRIAGTQVEVGDSGTCRIVMDEGASVAVAIRRTAEAVPAYPDRIAGRPATILKDPPTVLVRLRDDAYVDLTVSALDSAALAEKLVPLLLA